MNFGFDLRGVLPKEITAIGNDLLPIVNQPLSNNRLSGLDVDVTKKISKIIDQLGVASAKAQGLKGAITTAIKLRGSDHRTYIIKEDCVESESALVIGLIRIGKKKLFVCDMYGQQLEVFPLCVLDFYVHETKQRHGFGKKIFDHMIESENILPNQLAIDRPSEKFINFLAKHYSLNRPMVQVNNFVIFETFFKDLQAVGHIPQSKQRLVSSAPLSKRAIPKELSMIKATSMGRYCGSAGNYRNRSNIIFGDNGNNWGAISSRQTDRNNQQMSSRQGREFNGRVKNFSRHSFDKPSMIGQSNYMSINSKRSNLNNASKQTALQHGESHVENDEKLPDYQLNSKEILPNISPNNTTKKTSDILERTLPTQLPQVSTPVVNTHKDFSYTVSSVGNKRQDGRDWKLGTAWNVFGVPNSRQQQDSNNKPTISKHKKDFTVHR